MKPISSSSLSVLITTLNWIRWRSFKLTYNYKLNQPKLWRWFWWWAEVPTNPIGFSLRIFLCRLQKIHLRKIFLCALFLFLFVPPTAFLCVFCCCCDYCVIPWQDFDSLPRTPPYRPPRISEHYCRDSLGALSRKSGIRFLIELSQHWGRPRLYQEISILIIQRDLSHKL